MVGINRSVIRNDSGIAIFIFYIGIAVFIDNRGITIFILNDGISLAVSDRRCPISALMNHASVRTDNSSIPLIILQVHGIFSSCGGDWRYLGKREGEKRERKYSRNHR